MRGFIALITLLILFLISLSIGVGFTLRSIGRAKTSLQINQSSQAFYLANLCAEEALMKLKENINYPGMKQSKLKEVIVKFCLSKENG